MSINYRYTFYGLTFQLPFASPMLPVAPPDTPPDVTVVYGHVPERLENVTASDNSWKLGFCWQASSGRFLLRGGRRSGHFLVEGGKNVTVERGPASEDGRILFRLLHSVTAELLKQRGFLVLHANTILTPRGAIVVAGKSGTGKSTTLAVMLRLGCTMISDDITALRIGTNGQVEAIQGGGQIYLCDDAANRLNIDFSRFNRHPLRRRKVAIPIQSGHSTKPVPLWRFYLLDIHKGDNLHISCLTGMDKFKALQGCIDGPLSPEEHTGMFPLFTATTQVEVFRIKRPEGRWTVDEVVEVILHG